ncbi:ECF transporter S component [Clostridium sp. Ade.TY]|uniref:ECF transporter S component n=1 Tax=Clostridium sp. Ade.TY TaxID=1391647 RepID=UPI0003FC6CAA|nr:ECF transporter S component [Clostridium sp. Ade.TY]
MERSTSKRALGLRQMVVVGMLSGISIFMGLTGLGFIPLPFMKATIMHIPVIIGAIVEGPIVGALVGGVFGLFSMYQAFTAPTPLSFIFYNPIIAIVPRVLIGIIAYYIYTLLKNKFKKESIPIGIAAVLGTITNTVGVLGLTYVFYLDQYAKALGISSAAAGTAIATVAATNGIPEALLSALITIPVVLTIKKIKK